jgi:hypothetical protein
MESDILDEEGKMKKAERQKEPSLGNCVKSVVWVLERTGGVA